MYSESEESLIIRLSSEIDRNSLFNLLLTRQKVEIESKARPVSFIDEMKINLIFPSTKKIRTTLEKVQAMLVLPFQLKSPFKLHTFLKGAHLGVVILTQCVIARLLNTTMRKKISRLFSRLHILMMSSFELVFVSFSASKTSYGAFYHRFSYARDFRKYLNNLVCRLLWHILALKLLCLLFEMFEAFLECFN